LTFFLGLVWVLVRIFVLLRLWFGLLGGCIGGVWLGVVLFGCVCVSIGCRGWSVLWSLNIVSLVSSSMSSSSLACLVVSCVIYKIFVMLVINMLQYVLVRD